MPTTKRLQRRSRDSVSSAACLVASCLILSSLLPSTTEAQRVVPVEQEPRHRLIYSSPALHVLDVQIQPGDTTLFHTHATPITYVTIGTSSTDQRTLGGEWNHTTPRTPPPGRIGAIRADLSYDQRAVTHRVTNVGSSLFRLIAVPSRRPGTDAPAGEPLPGEAISEDRWFRHASITLGAGENMEEHVAIAPTVLVMIESGRVAITHGDGWVSTLERAGGTHVLEEGQRYQIRNAGSEDARLAVVEVR